MKSLILIALFGALAVTSPALAQKKQAPASASPLGTLGGNGKDPIKIDADRLDVFDRENRAVFTGNVVAVQGESTMRCTSLVVFYEGRGQNGGQNPAGAMPTGGDSIKRIECKGPVTVASKEQVATSKEALFDRVANRVILTGDAALSDGRNVTRGERIVYDLNTGIANVEGGRVKALFVPGEEQTGSAKPKPSGR